MTTLHLVYIVILWAPVYGVNDWTPHSNRDWHHSKTAKIDSKAHKDGAHLVLFNENDPALEVYKKYFNSKKSGKAYYFLKDNNGKTIDQSHPNSELKNKQLKISVLAHGGKSLVKSNNEYSVKYTINRMSPNKLADIVETFIKDTGLVPHERARFFSCNAGTQAASNYMTEFIKDLNNRGVNIPEVVAYRTVVLLSSTKVGGRISTLTDHPEELFWQFEKQGIRVDKDLKAELLKAGYLTKDYNHRSKDKIRMLFKLQDGEVSRTKLIKTDNNAQQHMDSDINVQNEEENYNQQIDDIIKPFCDRRRGIGRRRRRRRRSPSVCGLTEGEEVKEEYIIKEKSLNIEGGNVQVEIVNRQNPEDTHLVSIPLEDSFSMKQIKETAKLQASRVKGGGVQALENMNKVMSVYGIVAGFIGAGKFFAENDTARGAFTLSQSLHGVGEMTGLNQQLTRLSRDILHKGLTKAAGKLGMEKTLAKVTGSVERFGESTAGQFLKDIPFVGLAFQGYFIAEDSIAIQKSNRSDPEQNKYLGLKVSNLVLDVSTTVLTIAEVAFPPATIILEPIIIGLTIARMAIGDFYCDVVSELDHLPKGASDFDKMIAVIVGLEEGAVDFVTGGLLREMNALEEEQRQNRELLHNLTTPEFYFTVMASDGNVSTLNLLDGPMSQYGGFVTVRMLDDGHVKIQIGGVPDGEGGVKTIHKSLYNPSIQNIVLGVGESSKFLYTEKAAHLWWVIPVHHAKVICGEIKLHSSLFGNYYGNDKANQFIAPQLPENKQPLPSKDPCAYGRQDLDFVIRNYHYTIYGHGGDDIFFMGPQSSKLSGGEGKDFYIFPTAGSYAEIDNFANDEFEDQMLIKAPFGNIDCIRKDADLLLVYGPQRYTVTVRNWFAHSNIDHYQHMSFQSADGVRFKVEDRGLVGHRFHANCIPETLDKTKSASAVSIRLVGEFNGVTTVVGSKFSDRIVGNEKNNVFNGGPGIDLLKGGEGADTYEIFQGEGCDKINNFAQDQKLDLVVFQVPFRRIQADLHGDDLLVFDKKDPSLTCVHLTEWNTNSLFQHVAFLSSDHVTFHITLNNSRLEITAIMVDLSKESHGSTINLSGPHQQLSVLSVFDSPYNDNISGNALGNFLSCSGGRDFLKGAGGSDKYVIKSGCKGAVISNYAEDQASDVLFLEHPFENLRVKYRYSDLILTVEDLDIEVRLVKWLKGKLFQHLVLQTIDGVISMLPSNASEPEVLTPFEINVSQENCTDSKRQFDFSKDPFRKVERFKAKSSKCSYNVIGNNMNNYMDPGIGNALNYQYLKGGNGSDTYVLGHEYGYDNEIDNEAKDLKTDNLFFQVLYKDIEVLLEHPHVILFSRSRNDSVRVRLLKYLEGPEHQHLLIRTSDGVSFWVNPNSYPYKSVISIDTSTSTKSCNISCAEGEEYLKVSSIYGATGFSNYITGSRSSSVINGGNMADYIQGNEGNERIEGHGGNDIMNGRGGDDVLLGGKGDDDITGGEGNDIIYGGWGADRIDGGPGIDTVFFSGDVRTSTGVKVDLSSGRGEWADAQNDTYEDVESVSGTNFNDLLIGDDEDNELAGKFGNDTLMPGHGSDFLFGGPGNDVYILDDCSGVKYINNFASDMALDYLLLRDFHPKDACFFLQEGTLVISFSHHNRLLKLIQEDSLTVLLENWSYNGSFYQHMDFVFAENALVSDTFFSSAIDISPTLLEINSSSPALHLMQANETSVDIEVKVPRVAESTETTWGSKLQYQIKVSDQLFFSDSLQWTNQSVITYSGLLSGVLYSFQLSVTICEVPVQVVAETTWMKNPNPPTSVTLNHVSHSNAVISWTAPPIDSDPNSKRYTYMLEVVSLRHRMTVTTNHTNIEITQLQPATRYLLQVSSVLEGVKSLRPSVAVMLTLNLCPDFIAPEGSRVLDEKMTSHGPVVVIECQEGYERKSSPEIPCLGEITFSPCIPKACVHQGEVFAHRSIFYKECFTLSFQSICHFGEFTPPVPTCCLPISQIDNGFFRYYPDSHYYRGITARFYCESGYDLAGQSRFHCDLETGEWRRPFHLPSCTPIPCPDPPQVQHGRLLRSHYGQYKEGDVLLLYCNDLYHPSSEDRITCRNGNWDTISPCVPSARLINTYTIGHKFYGNVQQWMSGSWTSSVTVGDAERLSKFCCQLYDLQYVEVSYYDMKVQCSMLNLESSENEYVGIAEGNPNREGWGRICIEDYSAATSFCRKLFPDQEWTVSVLDGSLFYTSYTYRCNWGCRFHTDSKWCSKQIRCRATCDPYPISNGQVSCSSTLEGELCSVSCNRLYRLQGDSSIQCRSNGWSSDPYCIETGECGYYYETGPHSTGCLTKLWTEAGCNVKADLSPTKPENRNFWNRFEDDTVSEVRRYMENLVDPGPFSYNPNCQTDDECFPGRSMVLTHEGNRKSMSELRLGDRVLALGADGHLTFSEVILWLDRRPTARERYVLLSTEGSSDPLALSADHVTFIAPSNTTAATAGTMVPVFAKDLQRGHLLYRHHPASGSLKASRVTNVQETVELGAFAPMTVEGNLVVDGHLVSCYALQCRQYMAHLPFAPYRLLNSLRSYVPLFSRLFPPQAKQEGEGIHWYARAWHQVGQWFGYPFGKTCYPNELTQYHYP